ncbi:hypothetical protein BJ138DRAFT_1154179 [Hygrophoropsis aurantiaca]|uniref:Uncharacterized protein n=1 Tax=Hygrophoropsis aurantiaca TaxID=72124 RepID=A0ACB8A8V1_9AGAM|nr:hypothetical protein BJ138DRAFT_1154179 [Hygrophoropsis aurantiaca]
MDDAPSVLVPTINVSVLIGPIELGATVAAFLFGCSVVQGYVYYSTFINDSWVFKALVALVLLLETAQVMSAVSCMWSLTVASYGNPLALAVFPPGADLVILFSCLGGAVVHTFFIYRLTMLSKSRVLPVLCAIFAIITHVCGLIVTGNAFRMTNLVDYESTQFRLITMALVGEAVCDMAITMGLLYHLSGYRRKSGFVRTVRRIDRLILWTLETGLITGLTSILVIVFFLTMRQTFIWTGIYAYFSCIYTNSLLASLNNRLNVPSNRSDRVDELPSSNGLAASPPKTHPVIFNISRTAKNDASNEIDIAQYNLESQESDVKMGGEDRW